jgi:hypothetical protein
MITCNIGGCPYKVSKNFSFIGHNHVEDHREWPEGKKMDQTLRGLGEEKKLNSKRKKDRKKRKSS